MSCWASGSSFYLKSEMVKRTIFFSEKLDSYELIHGTYPIVCGFHLKVKVKLFDAMTSVLFFTWSAALVGVTVTVGVLSYSYLPHSTWVKLTIAVTVDTDGGKGWFAWFVIRLQYILTRDNFYLSFIFYHHLFLLLLFRPGLPPPPSVIDTFSILFFPFLLFLNLKANVMRQCPVGFGEKVYNSNNIEIKWKQPLASFYFLFISYLISLRRLNKP